MQTQQLAALALALAALGLLLIAGLVLARMAAARRSERTLRISRETLPTTPTLIILDGV